MLACVSAHQRPFIFPACDGGEPNSSPPSIKGVISRVGDNEIEVIIMGRKVDAKERAVTVEIRAATNMCGFYGGYVHQGMLLVGSKAEIWLTQPRIARRNQRNIAAVLMVDKAGPH